MPTGLSPANQKRLARAEYLKAQGLTPDEIAADIGVPVWTIYRLLNPPKARPGRKDETPPYEPPLSAKPHPNMVGVMFENVKVRSSGAPVSGIKLARAIAHDSGCGCATAWCGEV